MRALHICSQLSKSRINNNHFKLVSRLSSCGEKKNLDQEIPLSCQNRDGITRITSWWQNIWGWKSWRQKEKVRFPQTGQESKISRQTHAHTHIKPIWKSKWNHMWEELKKLFMFSYKFPFNLLWNIQIQVLRKFFSRWSRHMCRGLLLFCGRKIPGKFLFSQTWCFTWNHPEQLPTKRQMGKKKNLCDNCSSEQQN